MSVGTSFDPSFDNLNYTLPPRIDYSGLKNFTNIDDYTLKYSPQYPKKPIDDFDIFRNETCDDRKNVYEKSNFIPSPMNFSLHEMHNPNLIIFIFILLCIVIAVQISICTRLYAMEKMMIMQMHMKSS